MKAVFYGGSHYVLPILEVLDTLLIVTTEKYPSEPVISYAVKKSIPYLSVRNLNEKNIIKQIKDNKTEFAVLADFGLLIPSKLLNFYPKGIINIHPSLLPKYRGPSPVQKTILSADLATGVTIIKLDDKVDHGPVIAQSRISLNENDTAEKAYFKLFTEGSRLLKNTLQEYLNGDIAPLEQNHLEATFTEKLTRHDGFFHIDNPPTPEYLNRMINAYFPWPGTWTKVMINGKAKILKLLPQGKIQVEGKKPLNVKDFYNGYPELKQTITKILK